MCVCVCVCARVFVRVYLRRGGRGGGLSVSLWEGKVIFEFHFRAPFPYRTSKRIYIRTYVRIRKEVGSWVGKGRQVGSKERALPEVLPRRLAASTILSPLPPSQKDAGRRYPHKHCPSSSLLLPPPRPSPPPPKTTVTRANTLRIS